MLAGGVKHTREQMLRAREVMMPANRLKTVLVDFDGVLHSYSSGWKGADVIPDPPVPGAIEFLEKLVADERFQVCIYSSRSRQGGGISAMHCWLDAHGMSTQARDALLFPTEKPPAHLTIDDRAMCFEGYFPDLGWIADFVPWNKRTGEVSGE